MSGGLKKIRLSYLSASVFTEVKINVGVYFLNSYKALWSF